jgi:hypothetical protein
MHHLSRRRRFGDLATVRCYHCPMPRKSKPKPDNPEQFKRFIDMAREVGAEKPSPDFERVFRKVAEQPKGRPSKANETAGSASASSRRFSRKGRS